ncbi:MAG: LysM peptidoglycan-binding domain-containing protein [Bacteroidales bacterium]|nr:LysM peptidoglycan-binding domain-containing protein [Bacteroidales bacterium]
MKKSTTCPVCSHPGIPDYLKEDVVCPCCGTDLRIYRKIELAKDSTGGSNKGWLTGISIVAALLCVATVIILVCHWNSVSSYKAQLNEKEQTISDLERKVKDLGHQINEKEVTTKEDIVLYTVKEGDSLWRISRIFYGTGSRYGEIMELNNLTPSTVLQIGDKIKVKIE